MADPGPARRTTIDDVAAAAGVSRAAVSKVLRNAYGVSDAMRARVTAAMAELHYRPRIAARSMRGRSYTIGVELPDISNQFFSRVIRGAMQELEGTPYQLIIAPAEVGSREGLRATEALVDRQVDGVIVVSARVRRPDLERIGRSAPLVMFGRFDITDVYDSVAGDDVAGARAALEHLRVLGHERIAHLTLLEATSSDNLPHSVRLQEYLRSMAATGIDAAELLWRTDEGQEAAYDVVREMLARGTDATAVFAGHDELAIGALRAVADAGADISVVGYDDVPIAAHPALRLTTVHQPGEAMGARAVQLLLERVGGRTEPVHETFPAELVVRGSTRPHRP